MASNFRNRSWTPSLVALAMGLCWLSPAVAQDTPAPASADPSEDEQDIVVTGFRGSLEKSLRTKRNEIGVVDSITAEDIGKFPDSNLAESMQRLPGVAITRGDGGEGKTISVRGLGAQFTRVRLNGMEGASSAGSSDIRSGYVSSRSFDFSTFASELFSELTVRKTYSADIEEGSLGATVDLQTPRPLSAAKDLTVAVSAQATYDDLRDRMMPRVTGLISKKFLDDTFGVAASVAWTKRHTREEGWSAIDVLQGSLNRFCSPVGYTPQSPGTSTLNGTNATNCSTGNPRLPNTTTNNANYALVDNADTFIPRSPRLVRSDQDYTRFGATVTLEARPDDVTRFALDGLFSRYDVTRSDQTITALSFSRNAGGHGSAETSVLEAVRDPNGTLLYGKFNGVDLTNDLTYSKYTTTFGQINLSGSRDFGGFQLDGYVGMSRTIYDKPVRTQIATFANNVNNFSFDFRGDRRFPTIDWGIDVNNPANFTFGPPSADGTVNGTLAMQRSRDEFNNTTAELNGALDLTDGVKVRLGGSYRQAIYERWSRDRVTQNLAPTLPSGTTIAQLTTPIGDFGKSLPVNTITSWAAPDYAKFQSVLNFESQTGDYALNPPQMGSLKETVKGGFGMLEVNRNIFAVPLRGNLGVRYVHTTQTGFGAVNGVPTTLTREYDDWLPSATLTFDLTSKLILRLAAAKVMTRPELGDLIPGNVTIAQSTRTVSAGNFLLNPIRAKTADVSLEYYFGRSGLIAIGGFYKDIDSFIQTRQINIPYRDTGLPLSLLGSGNTADTEFTFSTKNNTPGGPLKGFEVNVQSGFEFLPGFLSHFGALANFTYVDSDISYCNNPACLNPIQATLVNLSKYAANGTLYYEDSKFSIRGSASWRDGFLLRVPSGRQGSDVQGNIAGLFVDATASYQITPEVQIRLEAQNLTNQELGFYQDSVRQDSLYSTYSGRKFSAGVAVRF